MRLRHKHLKYARSDKYLAAAEQIPVDPFVGLLATKRIREDLGYRKRTKIPLGIRWSRTATTLPWCALLYPEQWDDMPPFAQASLSWHETGHMRQWKDRRFRLYVWARWRWALEVQCFRLQLRAEQRMGLSKKQLEKHAEEIARKIWRAYWLFTLSRRQVRRETLEILMEEIERGG
jgi:hypothetical protein